MNYPIPGYRAVPPSDLPLPKETPHPSPNDARTLVHFSARQLQPWPDPIAVWCLTRQDAYEHAHPFWPLHLCAYAAARDLACFQLNRDEPSTVSTLSDLNDAFLDAKAAQPSLL